MKFNEDSRVKIPTILHLMRLGYRYISLKEAKWDTDTNIFTDIFNESIQRISPSLSEHDIQRIYAEVALCLENEDLGKAFYEKLIDQSADRLLDLDNLDNNSFHVCTELPYKKDDEEFRPDIILLVNGMPLVFIEVKKPNNHDGIMAERNRITTRFQNPKFRKFINLTQLMVFSNNMEYDNDDPEPLQGAFYATTSYKVPVFNYFREEEKAVFNKLNHPVSDEQENRVLQDTNYVGIKNAPEFLTNKDTNTPTNRICTSLFTRERLRFILQYSFAFVKKLKGLERHVMRYPQLFATRAIAIKLNEGVKKGIIWHTQGSGKTALAFFNVKYLTDYFQKKSIIPKFYFIVDRLDLLEQARKEFKARGLVVHSIESKEEFVRDIRSMSAVHNNSGKPEITVVNIQKFKEDAHVVSQKDYNISIQRIYFLDEVHRSYNPKGSFLANLNESDPNAIKIGLTGTPLLGQDYNSRTLFGGYIHKYYYNASIADGYTLRLIREQIESSYRLDMIETLKEIEVLKGHVDRKQIYANPKFVEPMLNYVIADFEKSRLTFNDAGIGAMVVCDSADQAKMMYEIFQVNYVGKEESRMAADPEKSYGVRRGKDLKVRTAALILHDVGTNQERKDQVEKFKEGKIDLLFVYNMLLTGFDAERLKKLYIGRVIRSHNLLQALTRVNRTYKKFRYGYVVDFADIKSEFDKTNQAYFNELQSELGDEMEHYSNLFKSQEEIEQEIAEIREVLFHFDTFNAENFSRQISEIKDRAQMLTITRALNNARALFNIIRLSGQYDLLQKLNFSKLAVLSREANNHLALINQKQSLETGADTTNLLNIALEDILFKFTKIGEEEMVLADQLKETLRRTREQLGDNFDPTDPEFVSLKEELERLFKKKKLNEVTQEEMTKNIEELEVVYTRARELERKNQLLKAKYENDEKYARLHKRLMEKDPLTDSESKLFEALSGLKKVVDLQILQNANLLENENYVERMTMRLVIEQFKNHHIPLDPDKTKRINALVVKEYMNEYFGRVA